MEIKKCSSEELISKRRNQNKKFKYLQVKDIKNIIYWHFSNGEKLCLEGNLWSIGKR